MCQLISETDKRIKHRVEEEVPQPEQFNQHRRVFYKLLWTFSQGQSDASAPGSKLIPSCQQNVKSIFSPS